MPSEFIQTAFFWADRSSVWVRNSGRPGLEVRAESGSPVGTEFPSPVRTFAYSPDFQSRAVYAIALHSRILLK
jgi:hypothetical protein